MFFPEKDHFVKFKIPKSSKNCFAAELIAENKIRSQNIKVKRCKFGFDGRKVKCLKC